MILKRRYLPGVLVVSGLLCLHGFAIANTKPRLTTRPRVCVQCSFNGGGCRTCMGASSGGFYCETFNCGLCSEDGECGGGPGGILSARQASIQSVTDKVVREPLKISSQVIRSIATMHPRFAITLAEMNNYGGVSTGERRIYWTPIKFSSSDVERFLKKEAHTKYFKQYDRTVRRLNGLIQTGELADIVYRVSTQQTEDGTWSIKMHVESDLTAASTVDPAFSTLQIQAHSSQSVQSTVGDRSRTKTAFEWQIH